MHVRVRHPAPVRIVPVGGRRERVVLAACETEAEIPHLTASAFEDLGVSYGATKLLFRDGSLWAGVPINDDYHGDLKDATSVFVAWLGAQPVHGLLDRTLSDVFRRSPFSAIDPSCREAGPGDIDYTRLCPPLGPSRQIRRDLRDKVAKGVVDRLTGDFAIVEGRPLHRLNPMVTAKAVLGNGQVVLGLSTHPHSIMQVDGLADLRRIDQLNDYRYGGNGIPDKPLGALMRALADKRLRPAGRAFYANAYAGFVHNAVVASRRVHKDDERLAVLERDLEPIADLALAGLVDPDSGHGAVDLVFEAARYVRPLIPRGYQGSGLLSGLDRARELFIEPAEGPHAEDVAALSGLSR